MGELLDIAASEPALLAAWEQVRNRARAKGNFTDAHKRFERQVGGQIASLAAELQANRFEPDPVHRVRLPKSKGGFRLLEIPSVRDRVVERSLLEALDPLVDPLLLPWVFGFRRGLGTDDAIQAVLESRGDGARYAVKADVASCFDSIPVDPVLERLAEVTRDHAMVGLVERLLTRKGSRSRMIGKGLHQGSPLAPLLSNLFLDQLDRTLLAKGVPTIRYGDDLLAPTADRRTAERSFRTLDEASQSLGLRLGPSSGVVPFSEGVPYLGCTVTDNVHTRPGERSRPRTTTVYVTELTGGLLRSRGNRLVLERGGERVFSVALSRVGQIVVFGRVGLTTPLFHRLLAMGIEVAFLDEKGRYGGRLQGPMGASPFARRGQYRVADSESKAMALSKSFVTGKLINQRNLLLRNQRRRPLPQVGATIETLERAIGKIPDQRNRQSLLGLEGSAAREYFRAFGHLVSDFKFEKRQRRPPPDPVNSLLSFGYALLTNEVAAGCETAGLDPYYGIMHRPRPTRPSLALDLIEELRPVIVDTTVLGLLNRRELTASDFEYSSDRKACRLGDRGRRVFLGAYERRMLTTFSHVASGRRVSYRVAVKAQARELAGEFLGRSRYQPIIWK